MGVGALSQNAIPGLISGFRFRDGHPVKGPELDIGAVEHTQGGHGDFVWLHFSLADRQSHQWIASRFDLPAAGLDLFLSNDEQPRIEPFGPYLIGVLPDLSQAFDSAADDSVRVSFVLGERLLVTGRRRPGQSVHQVRGTMTRESAFDTPAALFAQVLQQFVERVEKLADGLSDELELIEDRVLENQPINDSERLAPLRQLAARLHRLIRTYRRALRRYLRRRDGMAPRFPAEVVLERLEDLDSEFEEIASRSRLLHDEMVAKLAGQTNRTLYTLSALTALFLPPTLVVGFFGMNFSALPFLDNPFGFWIGLSLCLLSSFAVLVFIWASESR